MNVVSSIRVPDSNKTTATGVGIGGFFCLSGYEDGLLIDECAVYLRFDDPGYKPREGKVLVADVSGKPVRQIDSDHPVTLLPYSWKPFPIDSSQSVVALSTIAAGGVFLLASEETLETWMVAEFPSRVKEREVYAIRLDGQMARLFDNDLKVTAAGRSVIFDVKLEWVLQPA